MSRTGSTVFVAFGLFAAASAHAAPTVQILEPAGNRPVYGSMSVVVTVVAATRVQSVRAQFAHLDVPIDCVSPTISGCQLWRASLALTGLRRGTYRLVVVATEQGSASAATDRLILVDRPPAIQVDEPTIRMVRRAVRVKASCLDDDECVYLQLVDGGGRQLAFVKDRLDIIVEPRGPLTLRGMDSAGQMIDQRLALSVESSPHLLEVITVGVDVADVSADRFLFSSGTALDAGQPVAPPGNASVRIRSRATGRDATIGSRILAIALTPGGAVLKQQLGYEYAVLEWRDSRTTQLGKAFTGPTVAGSFVAWQTFGDGQLVRHDLSTGRQAVFSSKASFALAANGTVVYTDCQTFSSTNCPIKKVDASGAATVVASGSSLSQLATDGNLVVFDSSHPSSGQAVVVYSPEGTSVVATGLPFISPLDSVAQVVDGWVAFLRRDGREVLQVWTRSPTGVETQISATPISCTLDRLGRNGSVMFLAGDRRFLGAPGIQPREISSRAGRSKWVDGRWYVFIDQTLFVVKDSDSLDADGDGLSNEWEHRFGFDPLTPQAEADFDGDGLTNIEEQQAGTHPRGFFTRHFAEGAHNSFFSTEIALFNPNPTDDALVLLRFLRPGGAASSMLLTFGALGRRTVSAAEVAGLAEGPFAAIVESDVLMVTSRTMTWDRRGYGAHSEAGILAPSTKWYLAEGATHSGFSLFYLVQNANDQAAHVTVTYLLPAGSSLAKTYTVAAHSRATIWVNDEANTFPALASTDVAATFRSDRPVVVERSMYLDAGGLPFGAGHESAAVTAPALDWFLAEGATGDYFDSFVLIANPNLQAAQVSLRFLLTDGTVVTHGATVAGNSRRTLWVDTLDARLADAAFSTHVAATNDVPIVVERSMWWPGPSAAAWQEAHNSAGETAPGVKWGLAGGQQDTTHGIRSYLLIANPSASPARVKVQLLTGGFFFLTSERTLEIGGMSRLTIDIGTEFFDLQGVRFSAIVESLNSIPIVVEQSTYSNAGGFVWAAGTNERAVRLPQ